MIHCYLKKRNYLVAERMTDPRLPKKHNNGEICFNNEKDSMMIVYT